MCLPWLLCHVSCLLVPASRADLVAAEEEEEWAGFITTFVDFIQSSVTSTSSVLSGLVMVGITRSFRKQDSFILVRAALQLLFDARHDIGYVRALRAHPT